ncbi:MAG: UPF0158 family protein [bacterium]
MGRIKVERPDIIEAFESSNPSINYFLNKTSGEVVKVGEDFCADETLLGIDYFSDPHFVRIPRLPEQEGVRIRRKYITNIQDNEDLCDKLEKTLLGRGALKRFVDILRVYPEYYRDWLDFKNKEILKRVKVWSKEVDIEFDLVSLPDLEDMTDYPYTS